ncbi:hypothetical protein KFE25_013599 [Diacronema lutheri]|uniref:Uncharacterized protein n=1 Tax=Diacronema lutheri TaxID=2081491 RepID=A0A8J6CEW5_DIALT|nr:hypothetical protein KFE25_013599 [Diacronema lutheri]
MRLAIATTLYLQQPNAGVPRVLCGLVKWCRDASTWADRLPSMIAPALTVPRIDVLIVTNAPEAVRAECPQPSVQLEPISAEYVKLVSRTRANPRDRGWLAKWWATGLTRYDLVLTLDVDIDLFELSEAHEWARAGGREGYLRAIAAAWSTELPRFVASPMRLLARPDFSAPVNTGILWIKPRRDDFMLGVALIARDNFTSARGWNSSGTVRELMPAQYLRDPLLRLNDTQAVRGNTWAFTGGDVDQGLFTMVYVMRARAYAALRGRVYVKHNWAGTKPWQHAACFGFYAALGLVELRAVPAPAPMPTPAGDQPRPGAHAPARLADPPLRFVPDVRGPPGSKCWPRLREQAEKLAEWRMSDTAKRHIPPEQLPVSAGGFGRCRKGGVKQYLLRRRGRRQ